MFGIAIFIFEPVGTDNVVAIAIGIIGFGGTILGLYFAYRQLAAARRASQGQFLLQLADHFRHFDKIHRSLLDTEKLEPWEPPKDDWVSVVQYMGLFERCKVLIDCDVLNLSEFERQYGYRFRHLVSKQSVRDRYFADTETAEGWEDFRKIWAELDVAYEARRQRQPQHPIGCLNPSSERSTRK